MKKIANKSFPLFYLKESDLEEKYRTKEGYTYMHVNGYEVRWPSWENLMAALEDHTAEFFVPGGTWGSRWAMKSRIFKEGQIYEAAGSVERDRGRHPDLDLH